MPRRKASRKGRTPSKKNQNGRKRYDAANKIVRSRLPSTIVPDIAYTVLKYTDRFAPTPALGANYHQVYSGTGLYDPDYTGAGHQPMGFDQFMALYQYFRVSASKIVVRTLDNGTTANAVQHEQSIVPTVSPTDLVTADPEQVREMPFSKWRLVSTHTGRGSTVQSNYMTYKKIIGRTPGGLGTNQYGSVGANPGSNFFWHINGQTIDESTTMTDVYCYVTLTYYVEFSGRVTLAQS